MTEEFYSTITALQQPITPHVVEHNAAPSSPQADFTAWLLDQLQPRVGESILNIGCGNGKQALAVARRIGDTGYLLAVDRSYRALSALSQSSQQHGLEHRIRFLYLNLDELDGHLRADDFDRALGARALSHMKQPQVVMRAIHQALKPGGVFFFYGPSRKDLAELRLFIAALSPEPATEENKDLLFIERVALPHAREIFPQIELVQFENKLRFDSPDELFARWYESSLYEEELENAFRRAAVQHFQSQSYFETAQRIIGIRATKA